LYMFQITTKGVVFYRVISFPLLLALFFSHDSH
jgi:hypothetical protein